MWYDLDRDLAKTSWCPQVAANLTEPGDSVLLLNSGYFGDSFTEWYANVYVPCSTMA